VACLQMLQTAKTADEIIRQVQNPQLAAGLSDELDGFDVLLVQPKLLQLCQCAIMVLRPLQPQICTLRTAANRTTQANGKVRHSPCAGVHVLCEPCWKILSLCCDALYNHSVTHQRAVQMMPTGLFLVRYNTVLH